jgi:hypothetical protein
MEISQVEVQINFLAFQFPMLHKNLLPKNMLHHHLYQIRIEKLNSIPVQTIVCEAPQETCIGYLIEGGLETKIGDGLEETV